MHKVRNASNAALVGMALGFAIVVAYLPGGYDALMFYLRPLFPESTAPAWIYLVTAPLSKLPWPLGWQVLVFATILSAGIASRVWGNTRWWLVACSAPMVWTIWLGQIEVFPLVGLVVGGLVLQRKIHSTWLGIACLALMTKPQVGYGILLFFTYRTWSDKDLGLQALLKALIPIAGVLVITVLIWPEWPLNWLRTLSEFQPTWWNAAVWPYGLLGWPVALVAARRANTLQSVRMFSAASLLGSPYFALYHCVTCLSLAHNPLGMVLSWAIIVAGWILSVNWMHWGWLVPAVVLLVDAAVIHRARPTTR